MLKAMLFPSPNGDVLVKFNFYLVRTIKFAMFPSPNGDVLVKSPYFSRVTLYEYCFRPLTGMCWSNSVPLPPRA